MSFPSVQETRLSESVGRTLDVQQTTQQIRSGLSIHLTCSVRLIAGSPAINHASFLLDNNVLICLTQASHPFPPALNEANGRCWLSLLLLPHTRLRAAIRVRLSPPSVCNCSLAPTTKAVINPGLIYAPVDGIASDHKMYPGDWLAVCVCVCICVRNEN